jgi:hypothetical protein
MEEITMEITFRPYKRKDGSLMLYINRSNRVALGISPEKGFTPYGTGSTDGMRNAYAAACSVIKIHGKPFTGDLSKHTESGFCAPVPLANGWTLVGTDVAEIGGMKVGSDGHYLVADGLIVPIGDPLDEDENGMKAW